MVKEMTRPLGFYALVLIFKGRGFLLAIYLVIWRLILLCFCYAFADAPESDRFWLSWGGGSQPVSQPYIYYCINFPTIVRDIE